MQKATKLVIKLHAHLVQFACELDSTRCRGNFSFLNWCAVSFTAFVAFAFFSFLLSQARPLLMVGSSLGTCVPCTHPFSTHSIGKLTLRYAYGIGINYKREYVLAGLIPSFFSLFPGSIPGFWIQMLKTVSLDFGNSEVPLWIVLWIDSVASRKWEPWCIV